MPSTPPQNLTPDPATGFNVPALPLDEHTQGDLTQNIGAKVGSSLVWMLGTSVIVKGLSFIAQIVLGWYLTQGDFGVFALAWSIIGVATFVREGGSRDYLIQQGPRRYGELVGPLFWMAMAITMGLAGVLLSLAGLMAAFPGALPPAYRSPQLPWLLVMGAGLMALATPSAFTSAKLQLELRFDTLSRVQIGSGFLRYTVMIGMAIAGYGPFSFLWAYLAVQVYELLAFRKVVGVNLFRLPAKPHLWRGYITLTIWLAVGFFGNFLVEWGNAAGVGLFADEKVVGLYYFAFNLVVQLVILLSVNAQSVLMPALSRLNHQPERQGQAILRVTRSLMLLASAMCLGFAVIAESAMQFIWHSKWEPAVLAVQIFGIFFPMRMTYGLTLAIMQAKGQFKRWALTSCAEAAAMFAAAAAGAWLGLHVPAVTRLVDNPAAMSALCVGATMAIARSLVTADTLGRAGISPLQRVGAQFPAWGIGLLAAAACWWLDYALMGPRQWGQIGHSIAVNFHLSARWTLPAQLLLRGGMLGLTFTVLFVLLVRTLLPGHLQDAIAFSPRRIRGVAGKLLFVPTP